MKTQVTSKFAASAALVLALSVFLAFSCDNGYGVFHDIQTETKQVGTDRFKNTTVKALGEDGLNYYAVMAKVYYRAFADDSWSLLSVNGVSDYYAAGFASDGSSRIWVATMDAAGTDLYGVYCLTAGGSTLSSTLDVSAMGLGSTVTLDALFWAGDTLYALVHDHTAARYSLYYSDGSTAFAAVTGCSAMIYPVLDVVKAGTTYWALTQARVYTGSNSSFAADATTSTPTGSITTSTSGSVLGGIATDHLGDVLVTRSDGYLFTLTSGSWSSKAVLDSVVLGALAEVPTTRGGSDYRVLVSKHNSTYGYCEWDASTSTELEGNHSDAVFSPTASGYTTTIYSKPVQTIHYSAAKGTILIALASQSTDTYALYSNTYSGSDWSGWTAE